MGRSPQYPSANPPHRLYPHTIPDPVYPAHYEVRTVSRKGGIRWCHGWVNVSQVFAEEYLGMEEVDDGVWAVYFRPLLLGRFVKEDLKLYGRYAHN